MSNPEEGHVPQPPSKRSLLAWTGAAALVGLVVVFGAVLPAEFNKDPLGIGKATGISRLWAPAQKEIGGQAAVSELAQFHPGPARSDVIEIPLGCVGCGIGPYSLEYKVRMKKGAVLLYDWKAYGLKDGQQLEYDFHGHTLTVPGQEMTVATHRKAKGDSGHGSLVAPFDGIQGWYFDNASPEPVVIQVRLRGYYDLVPPGEEGNEEGIVANEPVDPEKGLIQP